MRAKLTIHLTKCHAGESEVTAAIALCGDERDEAFGQLRKRGIIQYNRKVLANGGTEADCIRERNRDTNVKGIKICPICEGFYSKGYLPVHKKKCAIVPLDRYLKSLPLSTLSSVSQSDVCPVFKEKCLNAFHEGQTKDTCNTDWMIRTVGLHQYNRKHDKKASMTDMRRLAHLLRHCNVVAARQGLTLTGEKLFDRTYYHILMEGVQCYTNPDGKHKPNLLVALSYLVKNAAEIIRAEYLIKKKDSEANEITLFLQVLRSKWQVLTKESVDAQHLRSQEILRRPLELPLEEDLITLRNHISRQISSLLKDKKRQWTSPEFTHLRDLLSTRLTLFNARRGNEASRLLLSEFEDAINDTWIDPRLTKDLDEADKLLHGQFKLAYMPGKNRRLVSVLIPEDTVEGLRMLVKLRSHVDVRPNNPYLFAATRTSETYTPGNQSMQRACRDAGIVDSERVTGGKHRVL